MIQIGQLEPFFRRSYRRFGRSTRQRMALCSATNPIIPYFIPLISNPLSPNRNGSYRTIRKVFTDYPQDQDPAQLHETIHPQSLHAEHQINRFQAELPEVWEEHKAEDASEVNCWTFEGSAVALTPSDHHQIGIRGSWFKSVNLSGSNPSS